MVQLGACQTITYRWVMVSMKKEHGLTLTEILASIVILSIILTAFMLVFVHSSQTTTDSKGILDATYFAQTEMEEIININTSNNKKGALKGNLVDLGYISKPCNQKNEGYRDCYGLVKNHYYVEVGVDESNPELANIILRLYKEESDQRLKAQMERVIAFGNESDENETK